MEIETHRIANAGREIRFLLQKLFKSPFTPHAWHFQCPVSMFTESESSVSSWKGHSALALIRAFPNLNLCRCLLKKIAYFHRPASPKAIVFGSSAGSRVFDFTVPISLRWFRSSGRPLPSKGCPGDRGVSSRWPTGNISKRSVQPRLRRGELPKKAIRPDGGAGVNGQWENFPACPRSRFLRSIDLAAKTWVCTKIKAYLRVNSLFRRHHQNAEWTT